MSRPFKCRRIHSNPRFDYFKPRAIPLSMLEEVTLTVDEFEAIRLADNNSMYQEEAAKKMNVSRQTFGNIIKSAHEKIADALINGKAIKIEGGVYKLAGQQMFLCCECKCSWEIAQKTGKPYECPYCRSRNIHSHKSDKGGDNNSG